MLKQLHEIRPCCWVVPPFWNFIFELVEKARPFSFFQRALPLKNLEVYGKLLKGTKAKTRGNRGHGLRSFICVIPGLWHIKLIYFIERIPGTKKGPNIFPWLEDSAKGQQLNKSENIFSYPCGMIRIRQSVTYSLRMGFWWLDFWCTSITQKPIIINHFIQLDGNWESVRSEALLSW